MSPEIQEVKITTDYDVMCEGGHHEDEHLNFLFSPEDNVLMVDVEFKKAKFCFNCGAAIK